MTRTGSSGEIKGKNVDLKLNQGSVVVYFLFN